MEVYGYYVHAWSPLDGTFNDLRMELLYLKPLGYGRGVDVGACIMAESQPHKERICQYCKGTACM